MHGKDNVIDNMNQTISAFINYGLDVKNETSNYICDSLIKWIHENEEQEGGCGNLIVYSKDLINKIESFKKEKKDGRN